MNIKEIQDLILTMDKTSIENVDIENSEIKISISKNKKVEMVQSQQQSPVQSVVSVPEQNHAPETHTNQTISKEFETQKEEIKECQDMFVVKSPIVGTFYDAASPDSGSFVKIGDKIELGQTLCIIEAMKIMNQIESEVTGEVYEILVKNEDVVEYNQPLMIVRR